MRNERKTVALTPEEKPAYYAWLWDTTGASPSRKPSTVDASAYNKFKRVKVSYMNRAAFLGS